MKKSKLMPNYGWVQNTSNLSTIRDTIDLVPEHGITHYELMNEIKKFRIKNNDLPDRWTWDARCRIKAIHATGLVTLNRHIQGYELTSIGKELKKCEKFNNNIGEKRKLTEEEIKVFQKGLLTNPPVVRVLSLLNIDKNGENKGLSKYDIGQQLGFVGDVGFTHIDPFWVVNQGLSFNDKEGDADKWARTILSWLNQIGWAVIKGYQDVYGKKLQLYEASNDVNNVLRYSINSIIRNVPMEMLCSGHHGFPKLIQKRRALILKSLSEGPITKNKVIKNLMDKNIEISNEVFEFELLNLKNTGFRVVHDGGYYKLLDKINLEYVEETVPTTGSINIVEQLIENLVVKYGSTIPMKLVDHLIRFGYDGEKGTEFEGVVAEFFRFLGYESLYLGQGRGRVTDILVKYKHPSTYAKSYGVIIDAKATSNKYNFPINDKRKMKEYIQTHGPQLLAERIPNHAFSFVSSKFVEDVEPHLMEIKNETEINGCAIEVTKLLEIGSKIRSGEVLIEKIYSNFTCNKLL